MLLDLSEIRQPDTPVARRFEPSAFPERDGEYRVVSPVDFRMTVHRDHDRFRLVGRLQATLELACGRCLDPLTLPVDTAFDLRYLPQPAAGAEEREVAEDDLAITFYREPRIDLLQLVEEQLDLALPMKPLCRLECRGLCPECGTNLNVQACGCERRWEDPRLAGLKALMTERKKDDA